MEIPNIKIDYELEKYGLDDDSSPLKRTAIVPGAANDGIPMLNSKDRDAIVHIGLKEIQAEADRLLKLANESIEQSGMLTVKTAGQWIELAKTRPVPEVLFSEFWFQGELCILFADTNLGKSILAVQIANSISRGEAIPGFKLQAEAQPVIYFDFELSDKQFENRYSINFTNHYSFNDNIFRSEISSEVEMPKGMLLEDYLNLSIEQAIVARNARVLIIDNLTYLKNETEKANNALLLMKHLKTLKSKYGLSILALAHTPKRDLTKPISRNDLQGSKMLINFCDSAFSIGESQQDKSIRYLKQIKCRNTEIMFDTDNICLCQINKPYNFLQFEFLKYGTETEHLKENSLKEKDERKTEAVNLHKQGISNREIARRISISESTVRRWVKPISETDVPF